MDLWEIYGTEQIRALQVLVSAPVTNQARFCEND